MTDHTNEAALEELAKTGVRYVPAREVYGNHLLSAVARYVENPTERNLAIVQQSLETFTTVATLES